MFSSTMTFFHIFEVKVCSEIYSANFKFYQAYLFRSTQHEFYWTLHFIELLSMQDLPTKLLILPIENLLHYLHWGLGLINLSYVSNFKRLFLFNDFSWNWKSEIVNWFLMFLQVDFTWNYWKHFLVFFSLDCFKVKE